MIPLATLRMLRLCIARAFGPGNGHKIPMSFDEMSSNGALTKDYMHFPILVRQELARCTLLKRDKRSHLFASHRAPFDGCLGGLDFLTPFHNNK